MPTLKEISLQVLALRREAGTPDAATARDLVATYLRGLGYDVEIQAFTFAPSSLLAFPIFGAGLGVLSLMVFPFLLSESLPRSAALVIWAVGIVALGILAAGVGLGWAPLGEGLREDANLVATRGDVAPRRWIVAHLDSKAQGHSMAGRLIAVWLVGLASVALSGVTVGRLTGPVSAVVSAGAVMMGLVSGFLAGRGRLNGRSHGARDNGTGVVAALAAAAVPEARIGILITGAEEFGLVGARVFARTWQQSTGVEFVNVDTVDQEGLLYLVSHNSAGEHLAGALEPALSALQVPIRRRRLPLGIFVDSAPLSRVAPAVTIGRLTWRTLRCIHTSADTSAGLSYRTAEQVGKAIASN